MERGDWQRAEELLSQAVRTCPSDPDARRRYAETLWHRGASREAITQLETAGHQATEDAEIAVRIGQFYLASGRLEEARKAADRALDLDPKLAAAWALRGKTLEMTGALKPALADYQRSLGYEPESAEVQLHIAELYRRLGQPDRALVTLHSLIDSNPPGEEPQNLLYLQGLALSALGRYNDAVESYTLAMQRGRPTAEILYRLAEAELSSGHKRTPKSPHVRHWSWSQIIRLRKLCWIDCRLLSRLGRRSAVKSGISPTTRASGRFDLNLGNSPNRHRW